MCWSAHLFCKANRHLQSHGRRPNDSRERRSHDLLVDWLLTNHLNEQREFQQRCLPVLPEKRWPVLKMLTSRDEVQLSVAHLYEHDSSFLDLEVFSSLALAGPSFAVHTGVLLTGREGRRVPTTTGTQKVVNHDCDESSCVRAFFLGGCQVQTRWARSHTGLPTRSLLALHHCCSFTVPIASSLLLCSKK